MRRDEDRRGRSSGKQSMSGHALGRSAEESARSTVVEAVLFDMDGVVSATAAAHATAWKLVARSVPREAGA
jgi:hypothetical protein